MVARAVHSTSSRRYGPFIAVSCSALPETLLESELFGYERGAFTGANKRRIGKFEHCNSGTILLDEIGDMPLSTQVKILRVLQEGEFERVGGNQTLKVDVRVLTSTNQKLEELIRQGKFREDLYYRLNIMTITLPPLRDRKDDIKELAEYFFQLYGRQLDARVSHIDASVFEKMTSYDWPGNVRELENTIYRSLILGKGKLLTSSHIHFDSESKGVCFANESELEDSLGKMLDPLFADILRLWGTGLHANMLEKVEKFLVQKALCMTKGNQVRAANLLGISRNTLRNRIEKYKLLP
jgi:transcriptional regulator with PAS, ATPase and Fis domain